MFTNKSKETMEVKRKVQAQAWELVGGKHIHLAEGYQDKFAHLQNEKCGPNEFQVPSRSKILIRLYVQVS